MQPWEGRCVYPAAMKHARILHLLLILPLAAAAQEATSQNNERLRKALEQHPAADTDKDGILTMKEGRAFMARRGGKSAAAKDTPAATMKDVRYGPHERNVLDFWKAPSTTPAPIVFYIHGGGFVAGDKSQASGNVIQQCLAAGVSFAAINYRYRTQAPLQDVLRDCARAVQFVRSKATEWNVDKTRVASYGGSAGAGTSLWLAFHPDLADPSSADPVLRESSRLTAAGALSPQATYKTQEWESFLGPFNPAWISGEKDLVAAREEPADEAERRVLNDLSMLQLISKDDPPVFLQNGRPDGPAVDRSHYVHHPGHVRALKKRCDEEGVPATVFFTQAEPRSTGEPLDALCAFFFTQFKLNNAAK